MKAYRNIGGTVKEIQVDVGLDGQPILPPDTTVNPRPEAQPGHYVTVVGKDWVQIEIPVVVESFESKKASKMASISAYRDWLLNQPAEHQGILFDGDATARVRLTQALLMARELSYVPPSWVTYDNSKFVIVDIEALRALVGDVTTAFSTRFYQCDQLREDTIAATTEMELDAVVVPGIPAVV